MAGTTQTPISIYTEMTPNPESLKFVMNRMLLANAVAEFKTAADAERSPLASSLFGFPFVKNVFITQNFVTITRHSGHEWPEIIPSVKAFLKTYLEEGKEVITADAPQAEPAGEATNGQEDEDETIRKIKEMLKTYVQPAVEMDGGHIAYRSYKDGVVTLSLQGACSGCPSSTVTLKSGIEGLMKRMVPGVKEVVAEME